MKTILFTLEYPPFKGGIANYYGNLVKYWSDKDDISVLHVDMKKGIFKHQIYMSLLRGAVKKLKANHVLVGQILPLGTVAYFFYKLLGIKYSIILHGMDFSFACRKKRITKKILNGSTNIICANSYVAELVNEKFNNIFSDKIRIVNPGVDIAEANIHHEREVRELEEKLNLGGSVVMLTIGRLVKRKGIDMVIKSMPKILEEVPNLKYVIVGDGPEEKHLKELAKKYNNIIFVGNDEKWKYFNLCDIFIMPSRNISGDFEGFGIVYLEANICGKPVIAGDSGGVKDAVVNNLNGLMVDPESEDEIVKAVVKLSKDEDLRIKLGKEGKRRVEKDFNWKDKILEIEKIL